MLTLLFIVLGIIVYLIVGGFYFASKPGYNPSVLEFVCSVLLWLPEIIFSVCASFGMSLYTLYRRIRAARS